VRYERQLRASRPNSPRRTRARSGAEASTGAYPRLRWWIGGLGRQCRRCLCGGTMPEAEAPPIVIQPMS
jgi:hypothetical protein